MTTGQSKGLLADIFAMGQSVGIADESALACPHGRSARPDHHNHDLCAMLFPAQLGRSAAPVVAFPQRDFRFLFRL